MKSRFIAAAISIAALAMPATAMAGGNKGGPAGLGGVGQAQLAGQSAVTLQGALSSGHAQQNAVNTNAPVTVGGGHPSGGGNPCGCGQPVGDGKGQPPVTKPSGGPPSGGSNSANQLALNGARSGAHNNAQTNQTNTQTQTDPGKGGSAGIGGAGQAQLSSQHSLTGQFADSSANANQTATNANAPVNVSGGAVSGGKDDPPSGGDPSGNSANQGAGNLALSGAGNHANTNQTNTQTQPAGSNCQIGCGGAGQFQASGQSSATLQGAFSSANADQTAVNANVPVNISAGDISGGQGDPPGPGGNSANQGALNGAGSLAGNNANTNQTNTQTQTAGSNCQIGCGGAGQAQLSDQNSLTAQLAASCANASQTVVNANVPVSIGAGDISGGDNSANQFALNGARSGAFNNAGTTQNGTQTQTS